MGIYHFFPSRVFSWTQFLVRWRAAQSSPSQVPTWANGPRTSRTQCWWPGSPAASFTADTKSRPGESSGRQLDPHFPSCFANQRPQIHGSSVSQSFTFTQSLFQSHLLNLHYVCSDVKGLLFYFILLYLIEFNFPFDFS